MDPPASDANNPNSPTSNSNMQTSQNSLLSRFLRMRTAADALPMLLNAIVTDGKMACFVFFGVYVSLVLLWLPFWLLTFLIGEIGVYALTFATIFFVGRVLIRLIAFPGSSHRVASEIEVEFARYSVRMIQVAANCIIELCSALLASSSGSPSHSSQDIPGLWRRTQSYRDRVIGVYVEVLGYLYKDSGQGNVYGSSTFHGNNSITGDIGNLASMTHQARSDGRSLVTLLRTILEQLAKLEHQVSSQPSSPMSTYTGAQFTLSGEAQATVKSLMASATELRDVVSSFKPQQSPGEDDSDQDHTDDIDEEADASMEAVRRHLEKESDSIFDVLKGSLGAIAPLLDPQPHSSVFGLDVLRGCVLSRYRGARQIWVRRPSGGRLDVLHIPADSNGSPQSRNRKAVLYCNPNAGLIEVATGMSLAGGNASPEETTRNETWTDFYTQNGYDVYLFNYAGFGRSHGPSLPIPRFLSCIGGMLFLPGCLGCCTRFFCSTFFSFKPTPGSLRADATVMGKYVITEAGVDKLVIHGESIGGMAASGAAKTLSHESVTKDKLALLVCDRTFCNLEATAQRLVGGWTGPVIRALTPLWSTDVASDFLAADTRKVVANDSEDAIIADASSLKAGVSLAREIRRGASTKGVGWIMEAPLEYRMADWENVGCTESQYASLVGGAPRPPKWPTDKFISLAEAFHFAACARRVGKMATAERKARRGSTSDDEGVEVDGFGASLENDRQAEQGLVGAWKMLACCDGLSGSTLGVAVKNGYDCTVSWLCCTVTFGGQVVTSASQRRTGGTEGPIVETDFDCRPSGYHLEESEMMVHPKPIPEVIQALRSCCLEVDGAVKLVEEEIKFCIGMLEYIVARLSSPQSLEMSRRSLDLQDNLGAFIELHCGHNSPYSAEERIKLQIFLDKATSGQS